MNQPEKLYHASDNTNIEIFEPSLKGRRDPNEGPLVFATGDISYASCFIVKTDGSWVDISTWGEGNPWVFICSEEERFKLLDKGGAIYQLKPDTFYTEPDKGTGYFEWVSKSPVKPISKKVYKSGLDAMLENGVQVFFVTKEEFAQMKAAKDYGLGILQRMQEARRSVNQQINKNSKIIYSD